ncbi:MAG: ABC transporter ATP-binding protein, partial [Dehalococcoidia bacterium]
MALSDVAFAYASEPVLRGVSIAIGEGEFVGLLGPNGSGKTTILRLLSGALRARAGVVRVGGKPRRAGGRRALARQIAVVPQELEVAFDFLVRDLVLMGRGPHINWLRGDTERDRLIAQRAMLVTDVADLAARPFRELSGGEKQRVALAM